MATVEEMRKMAINIATYQFKGKPAFEPALEEITGVVDTLISAVEERTKKQILDAYIAKFNMGGSLCVIIRTSVLELKETTDD